MRVVAPSAPLAPFVREFMLVDVQDETTRVRLPEPGLVLGVRHRGSASLLAGDATTRLPDVTLTAMSTTARRMRTSAGGGAILARFRPGGAAQFFAEPLHELFGSTVALDELLPRGDVHRLRSEVVRATGDRDRVAAFEAFLLARLRPEPPDPLVAAAVRAISEARGLVQIRALARRLGISQDPLEKRFRRVVGASPKQLASLLRLRHAIDTYRPGAPLTPLALAAGYFDQSHFSRELRAVTGQPAGRFLRAGEYR
jgi:AraC-like DNA-binding protein